MMPKIRRLHRFKLIHGDMDNEWPRAALVDVRATPSGDAPQVLQGLRNEAQRPVKTLRLGCILGLLRVATGRRDAGGDLEEGPGVEA